jgi:hypothetical protein
MPKPKHTMLPILVVLFILSYGLMTMLIVEQGRTIDTQRYLIGQLFSDSSQLSAMKGAAGQKQNQAKARAHAQATPSQATPAEKAKSAHNASKVARPQAMKPPTAASDTADERRALETI